MRSAETRSGTSVPRRRGRPVEIVDKTLAATRELMMESPVSVLTVEKIAERAGVHKTSIYRKWGDASAVIAEALDAISADRIPFPDTGTLEGDIEALIHTYSRHFRSRMGKAINRALVESGSSADGDMSRWMRGHAKDQRNAFERIASLAKQRGELRSVDDFVFAMEMALGMMLSRSLLTGEPLNQDLNDRLVNFVHRELRI